MTDTPTVARRTQAQRRAEARERLIQSAAELIADHGLAALTLADVGDRAGYSRGIANHHFGTKAALVAELIRQVEQAFAETTEPTLHRGGAMDTLIETAEIFLGLLDRPGAMDRAFLILWTAAITDDDELRATMIRSDQEFRRAVATIVEKGQALGDLPATIDATGFAVAFLGILRGVALQYLLAPESIDLARSRNSIDHLIRRSLDR